MAKRRIEITVETERIILTGATPKLSWCEGCNDSSFEVSLEQAVLIARTSTTDVHQAIKARRLHHRRDGQDRPLICLTSLIAACKGGGS